MHTTGIIHHFDHSNIYTRIRVQHIVSYTRSPCYEFPLLIPSSTYLAPSRCDRNCPPRSQVACKLTPLVPHCSLVPSLPNSQPFLDFPEPNVYSIRAHHKPPFPAHNTYTTYHLLVYIIIEDRTPTVLARRILHCTEVVLRAFPFNIFIFYNVKSAMNGNAE